ncbi:MAG: TetR/AcrR family transcriptional regulator [Pseudomonadota bacterium]
MARDTMKRRAALREALLDIAEGEIRQKGLASLRARDLAKQAGCAVGAIYNVFDDMTGLALAVNLRTFHRLGDAVSNAVAAEADVPPVDRLVIMAKSYLHFAASDLNLWRALFDVEMTADSNVPDWYLEELDRLFAIIAAPLSEIDPHANRDEIELRTRTLFSSVHGIVLLGLERRVSGVPKERIEQMVTYLLTNAAQ